jgi:predicted restriction endonuclease
MLKRGRKRTNDMYFGPNEEEAVIRFLESEDETERNIIFNEWLKGPLDKMIESIIRRYKLYRKGETFEELHSDTVSFLMTKVHKFEAGRGKKAYSYFGTISKNYILGLLIKDEKYMKQTASYEDMSSNLEEREDLSYVIDNDGFIMDEFIKKLSDGIKEELNDENLPPKKKLNENEKKVGYALIEILENWETAFQSMDGGSKYNKNSVLETMRNYTNLSTKDIRLAMKRFKELYEILKNHGL